MSLVWKTDLVPEAWDAELAALGGHPLQSAMWGDARRSVEGVEDHRWAAFAAGRVVLMARFEVRTMPLGARVAWLPRGPVEAGGEHVADAVRAFHQRLRDHRFVLCIDDRYVDSPAPVRGELLPPAPRTAWIDLTRGKDAVWKAIDQQWRYGVRSAGRAGVVVEQTRAAADSEIFFALCQAISGTKKFELRGSAALLDALLAVGVERAIETRLFVARFQGEIAAGAAVLRSGKSLHYFWGAVDRRFSKQRPGEAVHGAILDWAIEHGLERYDLEGIDQVANPGTYQFKMKMGAVERDLPGRHAYPLNALGRLALAAGRKLGRI